MTNELTKENALHFIRKYSELICHLRILSINLIEVFVKWKKNNEGE